MNSRIVHVPLGTQAYDITIAEGALEQTGELTCQALGQKAKRIALISNSGVHALYGHIVERNLQRAGLSVKTHIINNGEHAKSLRTAERVWGFLIANRFERSDGIVALGGGVVGDLAGFVAATYLRGINYVQIPTTLLSQIDSSVGGKTAVNHQAGKNLIGAFHQPRAVVIDPQALQTLRRRELQSGLYEALKYGIIRDSALVMLLDKVSVFDPQVMVQLIARCCEIKAEIVAADEREANLRQILNFGHTIGHALEAVTAYRRLKHGEAIGYGMKCAAHIAAEIGLLSDMDHRVIVTSVERLGRLPKLTDVKAHAVIKAIEHDKKVAQGRPTFILPTKIGSVVVRNDVPSKTIRRAVSAMLADSKGL